MTPAWPNCGAIPRSVGCWGWRPRPRSPITGICRGFSTSWASRPSGRDAGQFRRDGSAVGQCGARSGAAHRRGCHGAERPPRRSGASAGRGELGLPQPAGGRKEYLDAEGKVERVVEWFGYKLHLLVDVRHELALAYRITEPAVGDNQMIAALLEQARANLPEAGSNRWPTTRRPTTRPCIGCCTRPGSSR